MDNYRELKICCDPGFGHLLDNCEIIRVVFYIERIPSNISYRERKRLYYRHNRIYLVLFQLFPHKRPKPGSLSNCCLIAGGLWNVFFVKMLNC